MSIGGGNNLLSEVGGIIGGMFGGPIGSMVGSMLGNIVGQALNQAMSDLNTSSDSQGQAQNAFSQAFQNSSGGLLPSGGDSGQTLQDAIQLFGDLFGASPAQIGQLQNLGSDVENLINDLLAQGNATNNENGRSSKGGGGGGGAAGGAAAGGAGGGATAGSTDGTTAAGGTDPTDPTGGVSSDDGGSWLIAIAKALGDACGKEAAKLVDLSNKLDQDVQSDSGQDSQAAEQFQKDLAQFQAESQQFSLMSNATSNAIKSLGEAMTEVARKS